MGMVVCLWPWGRPWFGPGRCVVPVVERPPRPMGLGIGFGRCVVVGCHASGCGGLGGSSGVWLRGLGRFVVAVRRTPVRAPVA